MNHDSDVTMCVIFFVLYAIQHVYTDMNIICVYGMSIKNVISLPPHEKCLDTLLDHDRYLI